MNLSRFFRNCFKHTSWLDGMVYAHEFRYDNFTRCTRVEANQQVYDLRLDYSILFELMLRLLLFVMQREVGGALRDEGVSFPKVALA